MLHRHWMPSRYPIALALLACACACVFAACAPSETEEPPAPEVGTVEQAVTASVTVSWSGAPTNCSICSGAPYACDWVYPGTSQYGVWSGGIKSFTDPLPPGHLVTGVTVAVTSCIDKTGGYVGVYLNNVYLGQYQPQNACYCGTSCSNRSVTFSDAAGIPGYVYGGINKLKLANPAYGQQTLCASQAVITLTTAESPPPTFSPSALTFAAQNLGTTSSPQAVTLTNPGPYSTTLQSATAPTGFAFTSPTLPQNLAAGGTATFNVSFAPVVNGPASGDFELQTSAGAVRVPVSGTGVGPQLDVTPASLTFPVTDVGTSSTATLTLHNGGSGTLSVTDLSPSSAQFGVSGVSLPLSLAPGASQNVTVSFAPLERGGHSGRLWITSNAAPAPTSVPLFGTGRGPLLAVSNSSLSFPSAAVGASSGQSLTLRNDGELTLSVSGVSVAGTHAADFTVQTPLPLSVPPAGTALLALRFGPTGPGSRSASLAFASNTAAASPTVALSGTGTAPQLSVTPASLSFGEAVLGTELTRAITVTSTGNAPLTVTGTSLTGANASSFGIAPFSFPVTLAPGQSTTLSVRFAPLSGGTHTATFALQSDAFNGSSATVALTGTAASGHLSFLPAQLDFGGVLVGSSPAARAVQLKNTGSAPLQLLSVALAGEDASSFTVANAPQGPVTLGPQQLHTVQVSAAVTSEGPRAALLRVTTDEYAAPTAELPLLANGVSHALSVSPEALSFGTVRLPTGGVERTLQVQNAMATAQTITQLRFIGAGAAAFSTGGPPLKLAPNGAQSLTVRFVPTVEGDSAATLELSTADETLSVPVSGRAVTHAVVATPATLDFGEVAFGTTSEPLVVRLENLTEREVTVGASSASSPAFRIELSPPLVLGPRASMGVPVRFSPAAEGVVSGSAQFVLEGELSAEATVALAGTGVAPGAGEEPVAGGCGCGAGSGGVPLLGLTLPLLLRLRRRKCPTSPRASTCASAG